MDLYPHQMVGSQFITKHKYVLIGDEMGLGKTIEAIDAVKDVQGHKLIIAPAMLRNTWEVEVQKYLGSKDYDYKVEILKGKNLKFDADSEDTYIIISYAGLYKLSEDLKVSAIIMDECHYIKTISAKRTVQAHAVVARMLPEYLICLSGTPIKNNATEFYSVLKLLSLCPSGTNGLKIKETSQYGFSLRFAHMSRRNIHTPRGVVEITEFKGIKNVPKLKIYLRDKYLRRLASKVLDLPPLIEKEVILDLQKSRDRDTLEDAYLSYIGGKTDEHVMTTKVNNAVDKVKSTVEYARGLILDEREAIVIFTDHRDSCSEIFSEIGSERIKAEKIDGSVDPAKRAYLVDRFQRGEIDVLVCTIGAASTGFTLTKAKHIVFNDISWNYADLEQAKKRIHRISQKETCVISYMLSSKVDRWLTRKVLEKKTILGKVL